MKILKKISSTILVSYILFTGCAGTTTVNKPDQKPNQINYVKIDVVYNTSVIDFNTLQSMVNSLQVQFDKDLAPVWGTNANIILTNQPTEGYWPVFLTDQNPPSTSTFGDHNYKLVNLSVQPYADVYCQFINNYYTGDKDKTIAEISNALSHESIEMSTDPDLKQKLNGTELELCDAVQGIQNGYIRNGNHVSNFVLPDWYFPGSNVPYDFVGILNQPLQIAPGGTQPRVLK